MPSEIETLVAEIREAADKARRWEIVIPADDTGPEEVICIVNSEVATAEMAKRWKGFVRVVESRDAVVAKVIEELAAGLAQIRLGEGRYSSDPLTHAVNTIEDLTALADTTIARVNQIIKEAKDA